MEYCFRPIGYIRHGYSDDRVNSSWRGVEAVIEVLEEYSEGLEGLEDYSHIIVVAVLDRVSSYKLRVKPRGLLRVGLREEELPVVGVFSTASPMRPNPIAVTTMTLKGVEGGLLHVDHCDLYNGTPVLDIKPLTPSRCPERVRVPRWVRDARERALERSGIDIFRY